MSATSPGAVERRPDPEALLRHIQTAAPDTRGKLRIYFGASAGVGKTYAMLSAAAALRAGGAAVLAGVIETHGRKETAALLAGLEVLPRVRQEYRGHVLPEFDLDGALARHPDLILVDELAHSNAPGSRHAKRWQDIDELLDAGIDVWTTLNAQHLESLCDPVGSITGVKIRETVPDRIFDAADEVVLVDLPADELLRRLNDGKVYMPDQAQHAVKNFFRKGNLIALRELALRRTAERVDDDVLAYRRDSAIETVWRTHDAVVACIGVARDAEHLVRGAQRLARSLECDLHVVTVETPRVAPLPQAASDRLQSALALAERLGARVETLGGADMVAVLAAYVRRHNITKAVIGRGRTDTPRGRRWSLSAWLSESLMSLGPWRRNSFADELAARCPDVDVIRLAAPSHPEREVSSERDAGALGDAIGGVAAAKDTSDPNTAYGGYAWSLAYCAVATAISLAAFPWLHQTNIVMFYLLAVVAVALRHGRGPAAVACVVSVAAFDYFFVAPLRSFAVSDVQYLVTFLVLLSVGLLIGQLTAGLRMQARRSARRESEVRGLYELARELSGALMPEQIVATTESFMDAAFDTPCALLLLDRDDHLALANPDTPLAVDTALAQWVFDHGQAAGAGTSTLSSSPLLYLPLKAPMRTRGVLALRPPERYGTAWRRAPSPAGMSPAAGGRAPGETAGRVELRRQLDAYTTLLAIAIERLHYVDVAQHALINMESEKLRNSLLAAVSHDLRTPLTSLIGMADTLARAEPPLPGEQHDIAIAMRQQADRMHALVVNLLDMARLQQRDLALRMEWQSVEELVGSALAAMREPLRHHRVSVAPLSGIPLVQCDGVLMERVLCNLLENAAKYTPPGSAVYIDAQAYDDKTFLALRVADDGPGVPAGREQAIFQKFVRGEKESATPGVGLGLAVCHAIMSAHQGRIWVERAAPPLRGARFVVALPLGEPPAPAPGLETA
jgi:two-component system sensor histidine kinase KdpD